MKRTKKRRTGQGQLLARIEANDWPEINQKAN